MIRKGYWRILFKQMQDRIAAGENIFMGDGQVLVITSLHVPGNISLESVKKLAFAEDGEGNQIILNVDDAGVFIHNKNQNSSEKISANLVDFVDSLIPIAPVGFSLGAIVDDVDDIAFSRHGIVDDD